MLDYLDINFDEEWLRTNYLAKKLRCQSIVQSYNIYDSKDYYDAYANSWLHKAELMLQDTAKEVVKVEPDRLAEADQSAIGIS